MSAAGLGAGNHPCPACPQSALQLLGPSGWWVLAAPKLQVAEAQGSRRRVPVAPRGNAPNVWPVLRQESP